MFWAFSFFRHRRLKKRVRPFDLRFFEASDMSRMRLLVRMARAHSCLALRWGG